MSDRKALVKLEKVSKTFATVDGSSSIETPVLRGVDLEIEAGDSVAILGPSGSGKSTLLNILGTLEPPTSGRVLWGGRDLAEFDEAALARHRNRAIGFVFQKHHLLPQCTALENVLVPTLAAPGVRDIAAERARAQSLLVRVGLAQRAGHKPAQLSGGECQRVAVVRALIQSPRLLLADEPTGSLDSASAESLIELLVELRAAEGLTLVLVTHARPLAQRMRRVLELEAGELRPAASEESRS